MQKYGEAVLEVTDVLQAFHIAAASRSGASSTQWPSTIPELLASRPSETPHAGNPSVPSGHGKMPNPPTEPLLPESVGTEDIALLQVTHENLSDNVAFDLPPPLFTNISPAKNAPPPIHSDTAGTIPRRQHFLPGPSPTGHIPTSHSTRWRTGAGRASMFDLLAPPSADVNMENPNNLLTDSHQLLIAHNDSLCSPPVNIPAKPQLDTPCILPFDLPPPPLINLPPPLPPPGPPHLSAKHGMDVVNNFLFDLPPPPQL
jgi:hypothetical protein